MTSYAVAPFDQDFQKSFGSVSLAFSLFLLAPPPACLKMMEEQVITDLNETNDKSVSLLALKLTSSGNHVLPTWQQWEEYQKNMQDYDKGEGSYDRPTLWDTEALQQSPSQSLLCASMIFSGADPWKTWDHDDFNGISSCFFSHAVSLGHVELVKLLLSHPSCPTAEELDKLRFKKVALKSDGYNHHYKGLEEVGLMHFAANMSNPMMLELFVKKGMDVNVLDAKKRTPLYYVQSPSCAQLLLDNAASAETKDVDNLTVGMFWKNVFPTAAKQSEFNKLLIEKLKDNMSPEEIREIQKPSLFHEVSSGTKTAFEAIYRKSKFSSDVTMEHGNLVFNLLTSTLLRRDDKTSVFLRWCREKNVSWDHQISSNVPQLTNAMLELSLLSSTPLSSESEEILKKIYKGQSREDVYQDVLHCLREQAIEGLDYQNPLIFMIHHDWVNEDNETNKNSYHRRYNNSAFARFAKGVEKILGQPENGSLQVSLQKHPLYFEVLTDVVKKVSDIEDPSFRSHYNGVRDEDFVRLFSELSDACHANDDALRPLTWLLVASYAFGWAEKSYYNHSKPTPLMLKRQEVISFLKTKDTLPLSQGDFDKMQEVLASVDEKPVTAYNSKPETLPQVMAMVSAFQIRSNLASSSSSPLATKRRM